MANPKPEKKARRFFTARFLRWGAMLVCVIGLAWLATWLLQRSLHTPARKTALRSWLEDNLNADVALTGDMTVRVNLLRDSRVVLHNVEIEHPNPVFPGKMATIDRMGVWVPPWAAARLFPGQVDFLLGGMNIEIEQNLSGEWSLDGLMQPLASGNTSFPFPFPKIKEWEASIRNSRFSARRRGYTLDLFLNGEVFGRAERDHVNVRAGSIPFSFGVDDAEAGDKLAGEAGPLALRLEFDGERGRLPRPVPGRCQVTVRDLPVSTLPFFVSGIPMEEAQGVFHGLIRYDRHEKAAGSLHVEGDLEGAPLAVFGLPRQAPLRLEWPVSPEAGSDLEAILRMGPSGFGAFEIRIPLDDEGKPRLLSMRGDVAQLDDIPAFFTSSAQWPQWLSLAFPSIEWRAGKWFGFGWDGNNLRLSMNRSTVGLNLAGEAEIMNGRARLSMTPGQAGSPITVSAERLDAKLLSARLSRLLPEAFRADISGRHVSLSWRSFPGREGGLNEWGLVMVWANPVIDTSASGRWWRCHSELVEAIIGDLPRWGGGDPEELRALAEQRRIQLEQMSVIMERSDDGASAVEFRAYGDGFGQATGIVERRRDGAIEGELLLAGAPGLLTAVEKANPVFAAVLDLLANDSAGLRVSFSQEEGEEPEFSFPFLQDARQLYEALRRAEREGGDGP